MHARPRAVRAVGFRAGRATLDVSDGEGSYASRFGSCRDRVLGNCGGTSALDASAQDPPGAWPLLLAEPSTYPPANAGRAHVSRVLADDAIVGCIATTPAMRERTAPHANCQNHCARDELRIDRQCECFQTANCRRSRAERRQDILCTCGRDGTCLFPSPSRARLRAPRRERGRSTASPRQPRRNPNGPYESDLIFQRRCHSRAKWWVRSRAATGPTGAFREKGGRSSRGGHRCVVRASRIGRARHGQNYVVKRLRDADRRCPRRVREMKALGERGWGGPTI